VLDLNQDEFYKIVSQGIDAIPPLYREHLKNVAFIVEDYPTEQQRIQLKMYPNELLFGLYEGVPLTSRQGTTKLLPDKITIFKKPLEVVSHTIDDLRERVRHTIWHEVAHYYGLNHTKIHELEQRPPKKQ
jgi:predicted Zn-dependent protease with MMP-like domain